MVLDFIQKMSTDELKELRKIISKEIGDRCNTITIPDDNCQPIKGSEFYYTAIPDNNHFSQNTMYLPKLLNQDWSFLFKNENYDDEKKYYVYAHIDPTLPNVKIKKFNIILPGAPFYIGKGAGERAFDLNRNAGHGKKIKYIVNLGYSKAIIPHIIKSELSEADAFELESKFIYFFGTIYNQWRKNGVLYNLEEGKTPEMISARKYKLRKYKSQNQLEAGIN